MAFFFMVAEGQPNSLGEWKYLGMMNGLCGITNGNVTLKIVGKMRYKMYK